MPKPVHAKKIYSDGWAGDKNNILDWLVVTMLARVILYLRRFMTCSRITLCFRNLIKYNPSCIWIFNTKYVYPKPAKPKCGSFSQITYDSSIYIMLIVYVGVQNHGRSCCCFRKGRNQFFSLWFLWKWVWFQNMIDHQSFSLLCIYHVILYEFSLPFSDLICVIDM